MNKFVIKTIIGFLSLGMVTSAGILTKNYTKLDNQLTNIAKTTQKSSYLKDVNQEVKQAEEELKEAKVVKEKAEQEVKNAEEIINKASKEKQEAILELKKAKTPEERKIAQEKIDAATTKIEQTEKKKKSAEKKVEIASKTVEQKEENKQSVEEKAAVVKENENKQNQMVSNKKSESTKSNSNVTSNKTQSTTKNNTTTKQKEESDEQGSKYDLSDYPDILNKINEETKRQEEEIRKEAEKKTVEFHFYSTSKSLPIRCTESYCGDSGHIWFVEVECDLNKCEGFTDSRTGTQVSTLLIGRRADITSYTVTAPAPKYGYKFTGWELISSRKAVSNELGSGVLSGKYIATYEKI